MRAPSTSSLRHADGLVPFGMLGLALLTATPSQAAVRIWVGGQANVLWSNGANWVGGQTPSNGDVVIISSAATSSAGVVGNPIALASLTIAHQYNLSGSEVTIGAGGLHYHRAAGERAGGDQHAAEAER